MVIGMLGAVGLVFVGLAALIHVAIFALESILWTRPAVWRRFGLRSQQDADVVRPMAFNQGFYNLFLALGALVGLVLATTASFAQAGIALMFAAAGSMVLAALVLIGSSPRLARAAAIQGVAPLTGLILLILGLIVG